MECFDAHFHIVDPQYPLTVNQGYLPEAYTITDYKNEINGLSVRGGALVSASFQGFDQTYLKMALSRLGKGYVGVTQLPSDVSDSEIRELDAMGVRGIRFNLHRGAPASPERMERLARRVYEAAGWHAEFYVPSSLLQEYASLLETLPAVSIDHLGLTSGGFNDLLRLVSKGIRVKATGFSRTELDIEEVLTRLDAEHPQALMFGTDLPSTRAPKRFTPNDVQIILDTLGETKAARVLADNARAWYRINK
ncbi:amidohydrolase [Sinobaca sp. H24]|uniref:amidohydrolase family protein n=1 Tax=Sinobaca sp. H24 TaxID=2923376 RepID=UPI002079BAF6|nr:amidohydrolase family protein [Sinobaca sp. H24]